MRQFCKLLITLFAIVLFLLTAKLSFGQIIINNSGSKSVLQREPNRQVTDILIVPVYSDTTTATARMDSLGMIVQIRSSGKWYKRDTANPGHKWTEVAGGGGGGSFDSTFWANKMNLKVDSITLHADTAYYWTNGTRHFGFKSTISQATLITVLGYAPLAVTDTTYLLSSRFFRQKGLDSIAAVFNSGYVQKASEESFIGTMYNKNSWTSLSDFTQQGLTASVVSNKISMPAGDGSYAKTLGLTYYNGAPTWRIAAKATIANVASVGVGFGLRSQNAHGGTSSSQYCNVFAQVITGGFVQIRAGNNSYATSITSSRHLTMSNGDQVEVIVERINELIRIQARNVTTQSFTIDTSFVFRYGPAPYLPNVGFFSAYSIANGYTIDSLAISSRTVKKASMMVISDSKGDASVPSRAETFPALLGRNFASTVDVSGPGNSISDMFNMLPQLISLTPKKAIIAIGSNTLRFSDDTTTAFGQYDSVVKSLQGVGTTVTHLLPFYEPTLNQTGLINHIRYKYPDSAIIDTYLPTFYCHDCIAADSIHLDSLGHALVYNIILESGKVIPPGNHKGEKLDVIRLQNLQAQHGAGWIDGHFHANTLEADGTAYFDNRQLYITNEGFGSSPALHSSSYLYHIADADIHVFRGGGGNFIYPKVQVETRPSVAGQSIAGMFAGLNNNPSTQPNAPLYITTNGTGDGKAGDIIIQPGTYIFSITNQHDNYDIRLNPAGTGHVKISNLKAGAASDSDRIVVQRTGDSTLRVVPLSTINLRSGGGGGGGISSLNGLTASTQTFATGTSGTDFNISSATSTHTFNLPDASFVARGLVTTGAQVFGGVKNIYATNPLGLYGVQLGTNTSTDSVLTISSGVVKKLPASTFSTGATPGGSTNQYQYNAGSGAFGGSAIFTTDGTTNTMTHSIGSASTASLLSLTPTWNTTGSPTAFKVNVTNTSSGASALLMDLQIGGTSSFQVRKTNVVQMGGSTTGTLFLTSSATANYLTGSPSGSRSDFNFGGYFMSTGRTASTGWTVNSITSGVSDPSTFGHGVWNAVSTTVPQLVAVYDGSNYATFQSSSAGVLTIAPTGITTKFAASTTAGASINVPAGTAPTSPIHGDIWTDASHIYSRLSGVTYQLDQQAGGGSSSIRVSPLDSLAKSANGIQVSLGKDIVPQSADASFAGLVTTGTQTFAGVKTFTSVPKITGALASAASTDSILAIAPDGTVKQTSASKPVGVGNVGTGWPILMVRNDSALGKTLRGINGMSVYSLNDSTLVIDGSGTSGTYVPTITNLNNSTSITSDTAMYTRQGNIVTVYGYLTLSTVAGSTNTQVYISLPIASSLAGQHACRGSANTLSTSSVGGSADTDGIISSNATGKAILTFSAAATPGTASFNYSFMYVVQ